MSERIPHIDSKLIEKKTSPINTVAHKFLNTIKENTQNSWKEYVKGGGMLVAAGGPISPNLANMDFSKSPEVILGLAALIGVVYGGEQLMDKIMPGKK